MTVKEKFYKLWKLFGFYGPERGVSGDAEATRARRCDVILSGARGAESKSPINRAGAPSFHDTFMLKAECRTDPCEAFSVLGAINP